MKRIISIITICILLLMFCLGGCAHNDSEETEGTYTVYYVDQVNGRLSNIEYEPKQRDPLEQVKELEQEMKRQFFRSDTSESLLFAAEVEKRSLNKTVLSISFRDSFASLSSMEQLLFVASYVLTFTQIPSVDAVSFYLGDEPLKNASGENYDTLTASSFTNNIGEGTLLLTKESVTYYFLDESSTHLTACSEEIRLNSNTSKEQYIVNRLVKGPKSSQTNCRAVMDSSVKVLSVTTKEGVCYVNFDAKFLEGAIGIDPNMTVYAIVNSLTELSNVNYVQISINGETSYSFGDVDLSVPLQRNLNYIKIRKGE